MSGMQLMNFPSERQVLRCIADLCESSFAGARLVDDDPYLPIAVTDIARRLGCDPAMLFGYLYYYLDRKHRYETAPYTWMHLFAIKVGERRHCVNYPYLAGILAAGDCESTRSRWAIRLALAALLLSLVAIVAQVATSGIAVSFST